MILIFTTLKNRQESAKVGLSLLEKRLIACYNLLPVNSTYWWGGKIVNEREFLMIMKTSQVNFTKVQKFIKENSSYQTPEILSVKVSGVDQKYLAWLETQIK
jgi:periplasmic divalent cation tolerance protein